MQDITHIDAMFKSWISGNRKDVVKLYIGMSHSDQVRFIDLMCYRNEDIISLIILLETEKILEKEK